MSREQGPGASRDATARDCRRTPTVRRFGMEADRRRRNERSGATEGRKGAPAQAGDLTRRRPWAAGGPLRPKSGRIPNLQMWPLLRLIGRPAPRGCERPRLPPRTPTVRRFEMRGRTGGGGMSDALRVVLVDDEVPARSRLKDLIADCALLAPAIVVGEAGNGKEALELLASVSADLLLVDIRMP